MRSLMIPLAVCVWAFPVATLADDAPAEPGCAHAKAAAHRWAVEQRPTPVLAGAADTDMLHYHLEIELNPTTEWIGGSNTMTVMSLIDGLDECLFRLHDNFAITSIMVDGVPASWTRLDEATIDVTLAPAYSSGQTFELYVAYNGFPPSSGFGSIEFRTRNGAKEIWTLSEPWFAYTWWPAKDDNYDKTTADLWFTVPDTMVVASNGVLEGIDAVAGNKLRYRWETDYPTADYLYCIGATNYDTFGATWDYGDHSMPLDFYIYPEDNNSGNRNAWLLNLQMLTVFSDRYGLYPFVDEKYGMCQVGFGGGMEHQTMTSQGGFWESITAHELGHQWYGDMITCATWHDIWLNEGFATFSEAIWYGDEPGGGGMAAYHQRMEDRRPSRVDDSVYVYDISSVSRIFSGNFTYRKAAWVVHMLRHVLGDEVFFDVLAEYRDAYEYDSATTDDLQIVAEGVSGRDLGWFFQEWIYEIGAPRYKSAWRSHSVAGRDYVELYLTQTQSGSYPIFSMPIDVAMNGSGGDTLEVVWNDAQAEHLLFETDGSISSLQIDPDKWILEIGKSTGSFVEGPPKIIVTAPEPGASRLPTEIQEIDVIFHKDVVADAGQFSLTGDVVGAVAFTYAYDAGTYTVTLTPDVPLLADDYTLGVQDGVVDVSAGLALDGEVTDATDPEALPSGEGLPGGDTMVRFTVTAVGDINGDGAVDFEDILLVLGAWGPCDGECPEDLNGDDVVDFADLLVILANWS